MSSSLIDILKTFLRDYEDLDKIYEGQGNIYQLISNYIHQSDGLIPNNHPIPDDFNTEGQFWRNSMTTLFEIFNDHFMVDESSEEYQNLKEKYLGYSENMKIINNASRINIKNLNDNFQLIVDGIKLITDELFGTDGQFNSQNKYFLMFEGIYKEIIPLWENILYLWVAFLLKDKHDLEKPIIKYVYLNESEFINNRKFDISNKSDSVADTYIITINDVIDKIECYIDEYPNSHLCIIPIIRLKNCGNRYEEEAYPGIFYHAPCFNSQILKCQKKFIYYSFKDTTVSATNIFNPFDVISYNEELRFLKAGFKQYENYFYLGNCCGYRIYNDSLYFKAPFQSIAYTKEVIPKTYYTAVRSYIEGDFYIYNGMLAIENFKINYYDTIAYNVNRDSTHNSLGYYFPTDLESANFILLSLDDNLNNTSERYILKDCITMAKMPRSSQNIELTKIKNFRSRFGETIQGIQFYFPYYNEECICGKTTSKEEDYSYIIEYVPLAVSDGGAIENNSSLMVEDSLSDLKTNYVGSSSSPSSLYSKDNDLLRKHFDWDNARNNILEEKFVLRIGQHWNGDIEDYAQMSQEKKDLIPESKRHLGEDREYFGYASNLIDIEQKEAEIDYYNKGTVEVGAYLNIPFIRNENERTIYYPDFLSHTYGSENLVPSTSIEYFNENGAKPEYFSYNKLYRDFPVNKDIFFEIYTPNGKNNFSSDWCVKMTEVIYQKTPIKESFFTSVNLPPKEVATMEQIYNYFNINKNVLDFDLMPFFTQLCPTSAPVIKNILTQTDIATFKSRARLKLIDIIKYFRPQDQNETNEEYSEVIEEYFDSICKGLLMDQVHKDNGSTNTLNTKKIFDYPFTEPSEDDKNFMCQLKWISKTTDDVSTITDNYVSLLNPGGVASDSFRMIGDSNNIFKLFNVTVKKNYKQESAGDVDPSLDTDNYWTPLIQDITEKECIDEIYMALKNESELTPYSFLCYGIAPNSRVNYNAKFVDQSAYGMDKSTNMLSCYIFGKNIPFYYNLAQIDFSYNNPNLLKPGETFLLPTNKENGLLAHKQITWSTTHSTYEQWRTYDYINYTKALYVANYHNDPGSERAYNYAYSPGKITLPNLLSPFMEVYQVPTLEREWLQHRQYPHIYLMSKKTLMPLINLCNNISREKVQFKLYNQNYQATCLAQYFSRISAFLFDRDVLPYPFPTYKKIINITVREVTESFLSNLGNYYSENFNSYPISGYTTYTKSPQKNMLNELKSIIRGELHTLTYVIAQPSTGTYSSQPWTEEVAFTTNFSSIDSSTIITNIAQYKNNSNLKVTNELGYEKNIDIANMNLKIITHYFQPNGVYSRKTLTRELSGTINPENYFIYDGIKQLTYKEWTNSWKVDINGTIPNLSNLTLFKRSPSLIYQNGTNSYILNFEQYPNTGLPSEGTHTET